MDNINIPTEAVEAGAKVLHDHAEIFDDVPWEDLSDGDQAAYIDEARAAIRAALAAWPRVQHRIHIEQAIILPLPTEPRE